MSQLLQDRVALITGSSAGIGAGIAEVYAREGADVVVNYRSNADGAEATAQAVRKHGRRAHVVRADVGSREEVEDLFHEVSGHFGRLDVLVNNAGLTTRSGFMDADETFYDRIMDTDLKGVYLCSREAVSLMRKTGGGRIINISSVHATRTSHDFSIYAAAKGGVDMLTRGMAVEMADDGITVNGIAPGWVPVPNEGPYPEELFEGICKHTPLGRPGTTKEVGELAAFLASDRTDWLTGQIIGIDGGLACMLHMPSRWRDQEMYGL